MNKIKLIKKYLTETKNACLPKMQGSILAYSLIILGMMLAIVTTLSITTIIGKKSASSTDFSVQAYQIADSGVQLAMKKLNTEINKSKKLRDVYSDCSSIASEPATVVGQSDGGAGLYTLQFFEDTEGTVGANCNSTTANAVQSIKSIGTYHDTVRAVQVAVAATSSAGITGGCMITSAKYIAGWGVGCNNNTYIANTSSLECVQAQISGYICGESSVDSSSNHYCLCVKS